MAMMDGAAFTAEENEELTRVGPGTVMGELMRQYWIPVLFPEELTAEKPQKRVRLLGEDLVAYRSEQGNYGLVGEWCSHRRASLYFGRVEGEAIRCLYHGWLYGLDGTCLAQANLPTEHQFPEKITHPGYRCVVHGGVIWAYMGPNEEPPPLPEFEWTHVPEEQRSVDKVYVECNYLQGLEGGIDPTHVMWLHSPIDLTDEATSRRQGGSHHLANQSGKRTPDAIQLIETEYGYYYGTRRGLPNGDDIWRINQFVMPFFTMPPGGDDRGMRMWVPVDDENVIRWNVSWFPTREIMEKSSPATRQSWEEYRAPNGRRARDPKWVGGFLPETTEAYGDIRHGSNKENEYDMDWEEHYTKRMGIHGVGLQDIAIVENEGPTPILDRHMETLCGADTSVVLSRRRLLAAAHALAESGEPPVGTTDGSVYRVRGAMVTLPKGAEFESSVQDAIRSGPPPNRQD